MTDLASSLLDQVASGILILDASGTVCDANAAARNLLAGSAATGAHARTRANSTSPSWDMLHLMPCPLAEAPSRTHGRSAQGGARSVQPERVGELAQRVLQRGEAITRTGHLLASPLAERDGASRDHPSGDGASTAEIPADAPFVRLTLRPAPEADQVFATLERLPLPPSPAPSETQDVQHRFSQTQPSPLGRVRSDPFAAEPFESGASPSYIRILEALAQGESAASTAASVSTLLEERTEGLTAVVMRYDAATQTLHHITSPSLDDASRAKLCDGLPIRECVLCRTAVKELSRQHYDLTDDDWLEGINPTWHGPFHHTDARTCWTVPIMRDASNVLGVIVLLFETPQLYSATDPALIETSIQLIHIALQRDERAHNLRERTERLRQMTETMHEVFWLRTVDDILYVSDSFEVVWGRPVEDLYADPDIYLDDVHPDDADHVSSTCDEILYEGQPISTTYRIIRKSDGATRWVRVQFRPVGNEDRTRAVCRNDSRRHRRDREPEADRNVGADVPQPDRPRLRRHLRAKRPRRVS